MGSSKAGREECQIETFPPEARCASCGVRRQCLPGDLGAEDLEKVQSVVFTRRKVKRGAPLYVAGDPFSAVYAVHSGSFKTIATDSEGHEQVTGFFMVGEMLGIEGVSTGQHDGMAIALVDSEVCVMPYLLIEEVARSVPALQRHFRDALAAEIVRDHAVMMLLGSMGAKQRVASFLLNLSRRFLSRGLSACKFQLSMTRVEIGSYLGLTLETVSRLFSAFQKTGVIKVQQKQVNILDLGALESTLHANPRPLPFEPRRGVARAPRRQSQS